MFVRKAKRTVGGLWTESGQASRGRRGGYVSHKGLEDRSRASAEARAKRICSCAQGLHLTLSKPRGEVGVGEPIKSPGNQLFFLYGNGALATVEHATR